MPLKPQTIEEIDEAVARDEAFREAYLEAQMHHEHFIRSIMKKEREAFLADRPTATMFLKKIYEFEGEIGATSRRIDELYRQKVAHAHPDQDWFFDYIIDYLKEYRADLEKQRRRFQYLHARCLGRPEGKKIDVESVREIPLDSVFQTEWQKIAAQRRKALCPFHNEKSPSFVWYVDQNRWHCYGCGKGSDVIGFVMYRENVGFREALSLLQKFI